jgi:hypothetical protein
MPEVHQVTVIISNPTREGDTGRVTIGYYTVSDGVLTMTDGEGAPVRRRGSGELYKHKLEAGEGVGAIARRLTLSIFRSNTGRDGMAGFNRPLRYPIIGIA